MRILRTIVITILVLIVGAAFAYQFRTDPIGPLSGKQLSGPEADYPVNWDFTNDHQTVALEVRPEDPHSITVVCFMHDDKLIVPSRDPSSKAWPKWILANPKARLKVGRDVYRVKATKYIPLDQEAVAASIIAKYPQLAERDPNEPTPEVWFFEIGPR